MVQWLGLCSFTAEGWGLISGRGSKIPEAKEHGKTLPHLEDEEVEILEG